MELSRKGLSIGDKVSCSRSHYNESGEAQIWDSTTQKLTRVSHFYTLVDLFQTELMFRMRQTPETMDMSANIKKLGIVSCQYDNRAAGSQVC